MANGKHLTKTDRRLIEQMVSNQVALKEISKILGCSETTISRELKRNRVAEPKITKSRFMRNTCINAKTCVRTGLCKYLKNCKKPCAHCVRYLCVVFCDNFKQEPCSVCSRYPYVCNRCKYLATCPRQRFIYDAKRAHKIACLKASNSRRGRDLDTADIERINHIVTPLLRRGQSLSHIFMTQKDHLGVSLSTLYSLVHEGVLGARVLDMPRAVRFKKRHKHIDRTPARDVTGKDYAAYCRVLAEFPRLIVVEGDTVIGKVGGKALLTLCTQQGDMLIARVLNRKTQDEVILQLDFVERAIHDAMYGKDHDPTVDKENCATRWFANVLLLDRGPEFLDADSIGLSVWQIKDTTSESEEHYLARCGVYYCDPYSSWQKPHVENAHTMLRRILPKGTSFDDLDQADLNLVCSHINSYARKNLDGATPYEAAPSPFCFDEVISALGLKTILPKDINLTPGLLKDKTTN